MCGGVCGGWDECVCVWVCVEDGMSIQVLSPLMNTYSTCMPLIIIDSLYT